MRPIDSANTTRKNLPANKPIFLYTVFNYDGANNNIYFAEWDSNVTFNSIVYTRFPITHDFVSENSQGRIDSIKLTVCNISRLIQGYLELYDFRKKKVTIQMVWADNLSDSDPVLSDTFYIDKYSADEKNVTFELTSKFDILILQLPARMYMRNYCAWKFKGTECKYAGATTTCNKTFQACQALSNIANFGGFPSVPQGSVFLA